MCINLDSFEILNLKLGNYSNLPDGNHENGSVSFWVTDSVIKNICIRLSEFYSKGEIYMGSLVIKGAKLTANEKLQPETIQPHLDTQVAYWDDGVEVNFQYEIEKVILEFSWHWEGDILVPNYIAIEIE